MLIRFNVDKKKISQKKVMKYIVEMYLCQIRNV